HRIDLARLKDLTDQPVRIDLGLDKSPLNLGPGWFSEATEIPDNQKQLSVEAQGKTIAPILRELINSRTTFKLTVGPKPEKEGLFVVKGGRIIAAIKTKATDHEKATNIARRLGGDLMFKGDRSALIDPTKVLARSDGFRTSEPGRSDSIYVAVGGVLEEINSSVMAIGHLLFIALFATSAFANRIPVHTNEVEISLDYDPADGRQHDLESVWTKACKQLGKALERNSGPWGFGLFSEHDCLPWDRQLAVDANSSKSSDVWLVRLRVRKNKTTISMHWPPAGTQALGTVDINSKLALNHLTSEAFAKIIAASLLDSSPILTQISSDGSESRRRRSPEIVDDKVLNLPDPPSSLRIFRLDFDEGKKIFLPKSLGVAKISQESDGTQEWQIEKIQPAEGPVCAIAEAGRGTM
ncbi:MAG: hypothetical protein EBU49_13040, partial [Proteobacteria bacterium]|nr:hypothetical protein [Pseudomonadota bacterium]